MTIYATERQTRVALLDSQRRVLERIANGAPLREVLETLVRLIEEQADGMRCAVLLADIAQQRLRFAAAPNIPEDYKAGIEPYLLIAPNMGSCGTAAFLRKPVYTKDTGVDALWEDCLDIAVRNGLRAIWSTPILSDDSAVLGTFAMYYSEPRLPLPEHIQLIDMATQMARVAIEAKSSDELLRTVFQGSPGGMGITDLAGSIVRVNPAFARMVGYTEEELRGMTIADVTHEEDYPQNKALIDELLAGKREGFVIDKRYRRKDGKIIWVHNTVALLRGAADEPRYMVALTEDVTERRRAAEASLQMEGEIQALSRQKEEHLRLVIDTIPAMAWSLLPAGAVDFVNQRWLEYTGLSLEEALEESTRTVHPEDLPRAIEKWIVDKAAGEPYESEMRLRRADGEYRWFLIRTVPLRDEQGSIVKWYGTSTDIEDRKRAFQQIEALRDQLDNENLALKEEIDQASMFEEIVGSSDALSRILVHVARVAPTDATVLIKGETGTGKELVARAIHKRSHRSSRAFVRVNCAAIPPSLIASELFGHEKGAFTGATQRRLGRFELADGGTIFLDEIGELPAETQLALLRVLQEQEFERVGGSELISVDVRVVAATNRDLSAGIDAGTFRLDLFYRLNVFPIQIPPLRERVEDISLLVKYFIERYGSKAGKKFRSIDKRTLELFQAYRWPGNIRELQNVIERAVILCDGETFSVDETWLQHEPPGRSETPIPLFGSLVEREREMIMSALAKSRGRVSGPSGAAAMLGMPRSTLESRIRSLRIDKHRFKSG